MEILKVREKICSYLENDSEGKSLIESFQIKFNLLLGSKEIKETKKVGEECYESLLHFKQQGKMIPALLFVRFMNDKICYASIYHPSASKSWNQSPTLSKNKNWRLILAKILDILFVKGWGVLGIMSAWVVALLFYLILATTD